MIRNLLFVGILSGVGATEFALAAQAAAPQAPAVEKRAKSDDVQRWIDRLGSARFEERDEAMEHLRAMGRAAVPALEDAAKNADDPEVRWNARRLARDLRDAEREKSEVGLKRRSASREEGADNDPFVFNVPSRGGDLQKELERMAADVERVQDQMRQQIRDLREQAMKHAQGFRGGISIPSAGSMLGSSGGTQIEIGPDRVRVTIREQAKDGVETSQTYEAPTMEEFKAKHPEIAERFFAGKRGMQFFGPSTGGGFSPFVRMPQLDLRVPSVGIEEDEESDAPQAWSSLAPVPDMQKVIGPENGERLGVGVAPVPADVAAFLRLDAGAGFLVASVNDASQAEALGIQVHDLVTTINGKRVGVETTVREALASVAEGGNLRVEVIRGAEGRRTLEAKKLKVEPPKAEAHDEASGELKPVSPEKAKRAKR